MPGSDRVPLLGRIDADAVISHRFSLSETAVAMETARMPSVTQTK